MTGIVLQIASNIVGSVVESAKSATGIESNPVIGGLIGAAPGATFAGLTLLGRGVDIVLCGGCVLASKILSEDYSEQSNDYAKYFYQCASRDLEKQISFAADLISYGAAIGVGIGGINDLVVDINEYATNFFQIPEGPPMPEQGIMDRLWNGEQQPIPRGLSEFEQYCQADQGVVCKILDGIEPYFQ